MDKQISMPDLIRRVALTILVEYHPDGIQQVQLRKLVEEQFSHYIDVEAKSNANRFRNTLSTLDNHFPNYVIKENQSHKNVILKPTIELIYDIDELEPPDLKEYFKNNTDKSIDFNPFDFSEFQIKTKQKNDVEKVQEYIENIKLILDDLVSDKSLLRILNMSDEDKKQLPVEALMELAKMQQIYDNIKQVYHNITNINIKEGE